MSEKCRKSSKQIFKALISQKALQRQLLKWKNVVQLSYEISEHYIKDFKIDEAKKEIEEILEIYSSELPNPLGLAEANRKLGELHAESNDFTKAQKYLDDYLQNARNADSELEIQRALTTKGKVYLDEGSYIYYSTKETVVPILKSAAEFSDLATSAIRNILVTSKEEENETINMKVGLYINKVKIWGMLQNAEKESYFFEKGNQMMRNHRRWSSLQMLYSVKAELETNKSNFEKAYKYINDCLELEKHNKSLRENTIDYLTQKAKICLELRFFEEAKKSLFEAYKYGHPRKEDQRIITSSLKSVVVILRKLEETSNERRFEEIGDRCAKLEACHSALWYYKAALNTTQDLQILRGLYASIALTYNDLRLYGNAIEYYLKEYNLIQNIPEEAFTTLMSLAFAFESNGASYDVIKDYYERAIKLASTFKDKRKLRLCYNNLYEFQRSRNSEEASLTQRSLMALKDSDNGCEFELIEDEREEEEKESDDDDDDVDLTVLSEDVATSSKKRSKRKLLLKPDVKGETLLHRKAKKDGNYDEIKKLITEGGYWVDQTDYAHYTPLHEACNFGQMEYVRLFVENGADINRVSQDGSTPLISAAMNGYLDIINYLLDQGCKAHIQEKNGWSALDYLESIAQSLDATNEEEMENRQKCQETIIRLQRLIESKVASGYRLAEKANQNENVVVVVSESEYSQNDDEDDDDKQNKGLYSSHSRLSRSNTDKNSTFYESIKFPENLSMVENEFVLTSRRMESSAWSNKSNCRSQSFKRKRSSSNSSLSSKWKRRQRPFMISSEVRKKENDDEENEPFSLDDDDNEKIDEDKEKKVVLGIPGITESHSFTKVHVKDKLLLIPLVENMRVQELSEEAGKRYYNSVGQRPILKLHTPDGAELDNEDYVMNIISEGLHFTSTILHWDTPSINERYAKACKELNVPFSHFIDCELSRLLVTGSFSLSLFLRSKTLEPILMALKFQTPLRALSLPRNKMGLGDERPLIEFLASSPSLSSLKKLDLSVNSLHFGHHNSHVFSNLTYLLELNLSHNIFKNGGEAFSSLLYHLPHLSSLKVSSCQLTEKYFSSHRIKLQETLKKMRSLKEFDISYNDIGDIGCEILLSSLNPLSLISLNLSGCLSRPSKNIGNLLVDFVKRGSLPDIPIQSLYLSNLHLTPESLKGFLDIGLEHCGHLSLLDLSNNDDLELSFLADLLEVLYLKSVPIKILDNRHVENRTFDLPGKEFSRLLQFFEKIMKSSHKLFQFIFCHHHQQPSILKDLSSLWSEAHGEKGKRLTTESSHNVFFYTF